jgi:clan AA aspartic protease (TIGR02281 family)
MRAFLLACAVLAAASARADTIYLANGNTMKGVVVSRSRSEIVLDIGYGTVTLAPSDVVKIVRGSAQGPEAAADMRRAGFESGEKVPKGAEELDAVYRRVEALREKALDAKTQSQALEDERREIEERLPASKEHFRDAAAELARLNPNIDPRGYNNAIADANATGAGIQADSVRLEQIAQERGALDGQTHLYLEAWRELDAAVRGDAAKRLAAGSKDQKDFAAWVAGESKAMAADFRKDTVASEAHGNALIVKVLVNGRETGRFLVDTGASTTLIYKGFAARLALGPDAAIAKAKSRVADGRQIDGDVVRLASMEVGRSRVDGSLAVVVPVDQPEIDGLLGMSFLSRFVVRVDTANNRLVLESLK